MKITILTDTRTSWFVPFGTELQAALQGLGHDVRYVHRTEDVGSGDICFLLSCVRTVRDEYLVRNAHNVVIHASDLPRGKGFAPLQWQILEGKDRIVLTLFEAVKAVDAGPYYLKSILELDGTELHDEWRHKLGVRMIDMCLDFVARLNSLSPTAQAGEDSFYPRRTARDDELDIHQSILQQFNHFRIADNERFPLYFRHLGHKYILKVYKSVDIESEDSEHAKMVGA